MNKAMRAGGPVLGSEGPSYWSQARNICFGNKQPRVTCVLAPAPSSQGVVSGIVQQQMQNSSSLSCLRNPLTENNNKQCRFYGRFHQGDEKGVYKSFVAIFIVRTAPLHAIGLVGWDKVKGFFLYLFSPSDPTSTPGSSCPDFFRHINIFRSACRALQLHSNPYLCFNTPNSLAIPQNKWLSGWRTHS